LNISAIPDDVGFSEAPRCTMVGAGVLETASDDLRGVDDAGLHEVLVLPRGRVVPHVAPYNGGGADRMKT